MSYEPQPIDTSDVKLDESLEQLTERLAENTHEVWALQRVREGWRYGPRRDDERKEHPDLTAYAELSDSEREYDRRTALETLRTIQKLGYRIVPPRSDPDPHLDSVVPSGAPSAPDGNGSEGEEGGASLELMREALRDERIGLEGLLPFYQTSTENRRTWTGDDYARLADRALRLGEPLLAYDMATAGLDVKALRRDLRLRQLQALALARAGASDRANKQLRRLRDEGHRDPETIGLLARTHKDLAIESQERFRDLSELLLKSVPDPADAEILNIQKEADEHHRAAQSHRVHALELCEQAYRDSGGRSIWTGINAAMLALLSGDEAKANAFAAQVFERCRFDLAALGSDSAAPERYWTLASMGESFLIRRDFPNAMAHYRKAAEIGKALRMYGDMASTRLQARRILEHLRLDPRSIDEQFQLPKVAVFVGHMIDHPNRPPDRGERFPPRLEAEVKRQIRARLEKHGIQIGYSSGACGSDILFLEALLEIGGEAHVILPYDRETFLQDSVDIIPSADWGQRFERILSRAQVQEAARQRLRWGGVSFEFVNRMLHGVASARARRLDTDLVRIAVWDNKRGDGPGGTDSAVTRWRRLGHKVDVIRIDKLLRHHSEAAASLVPIGFSAEDTTDSDGMPAFDASSSSLIAPASWGSSGTISAGGRGSWIGDEAPSEIIGDYSARIAAILFADVEGFSQLTEDQIPLFSAFFLGMVSDLLKPYQPIKKNTWGDGLYVVFKSVKDAAQFALDLRDSVKTTAWGERGLPDGFNVRIGLHAGPVYVGIDPVTGYLNCMGTHVSHAARIEPITPAGEVYASQPFAALAADEGMHDFQIHYIGQTPLAKKFGVYPTYHVHGRL